MDEFTKKSVEGFDKKTVRDAERLIDKSPELKRLRAIKDGVKQSNIMSDYNSQAYKDGWERIFGGNRENVNHKDQDDE